MPMTFEEELKAVLKNIGLASPLIRLKTRDDGRVGGYIASKTFSGMSQIDRQIWLDAKIKHHIRPMKRKQIVSILTMTPQEIEGD